MDNLKNISINIISIDAKNLSNPNWDVETENFRFKNVLSKWMKIYPTVVEDVELLRKYLSDTNITNEEKYLRLSKALNFYKEEHAEFLNNADIVVNKIVNKHLMAYCILEYYTKLYSKDADTIDLVHKYLADESNINLNDDGSVVPYEIREEKRDTLYSGSVPVSLDMLKLKKISPRDFYTCNKKTGKTKVYKSELLNPIESEELEKLYTDAIINVTFDRASYELTHGKIISQVKNNDIAIRIVTNRKPDKSAKELREKFYKEGINLKFGESIVEYVKYKRSSSKAREGSHLFIKKELKEKMSDWAKFGIKFEDGEENVPLAAIKAYEGLTSSGIEKTINIRPSEILLIDDVTKEVPIKASVTTRNANGDIVAEDYDNYPIKNIIWDGQSLMDVSLFGDEQKGMMLLRNSFFKSCAFNTNIQKWFDDTFGDNKPEYIKDMFDIDVKVADIKLITTPSSLKFLKFAYKFSKYKYNNAEYEQKCKENSGLKKSSERKCYEKWLASISEMFGVCKSEKSSPFGEYHQLSYQIVNSLPLSRDDVKAILEYDFQHIHSLKNDVAYFRKHIKTKDPLPADALMLKLLEVNDKMWNTSMVIEYVKDKVDDYIANLRQGRIKVENTDYSVLFGNPIEMLQFAVHKKIESNPLVGKQIYCNKYKDGEKLAGFRNPHITMGNVLFVENVCKQEFKDYFNLTKNIVISNAYDTDIMERLQGQDYDSDTLLLSANPILVRAAEACQNDNFKVPLNRIEEEKTIDRRYTVEDEADIDYNTSDK